MKILQTLHTSCAGDSEDPEPNKPRLLPHILRIILKLRKDVWVVSAVGEPWHRYCAICSCSAIKIGGVISCARLLILDLASCKAMDMHWRLLNKRERGGERGCRGWSHLLNWLVHQNLSPAWDSKQALSCQSELPVVLWYAQFSPQGKMLCRRISMLKLLWKDTISPSWLQPNLDRESFEDVSSRHWLVCSQVSTKHSVGMLARLSSVPSECHSHCISEPLFARIWKACKGYISLMYSLVEGEAYLKLKCVHKSVEAAINLTRCSNSHKFWMQLEDTRCNIVIKYDYSSTVKQAWVSGKLKTPSSPGSQAGNEHKRGRVGQGCSCLQVSSSVWAECQYWALSSAKFAKERMSWSLQPQNVRYFCCSQQMLMRGLSSRDEVRHIEKSANKTLLCRWIAMN